MSVVFTSLFRAECIAYCDARPKLNLIIERDIFSGRFNVLEMS